MSQPEKKLDKFSSAVLKDAEEQRSKILSEIEEYKKEQMEKAEEDILHDAYVLIQNEIASIHNKQSKDISLAELDGRRKLLKLREDLTGRVFSEAAERIKEFSKTEEYKNYIVSTVKAATESLPEGGVVIEVKKDDLALAQSLIAASTRPAEVAETSNITLGGVIIVNSEKGIVVNETLDLKLSSQKDWFASSSGMLLGY